MKTAMNIYTMLAVVLASIKMKFENYGSPILDGFSNNGGIKFNLDGKDIVLSVDRTGKNINVSGGGVLYGNETDVLNLIRKIDSIWGR